MPCGAASGAATAAKPATKPAAEAKPAKGAAKPAAEEKAKPAKAGPAKADAKASAKPAKEEAAKAAKPAAKPAAKGGKAAAKSAKPEPKGKGKKAEVVEDEDLGDIEADLEGMADRKRALLGATPHNHRVTTVNALADHGPGSLLELAKTLDPSKGVAIVTEGLLNYFDRESVLGMWSRFARVLAGFPHGLYLADIHMHGASHGPTIDAFMLLLSLFVRSRVHIHFDTEPDIERALHDCGFIDAKAHNPVDFSDRIDACDRKWAKLVRVIEAKTSAGHA